MPSSDPARAPPTSRTRSPTRNGRVPSSTRPANRLPSVCWAARPSTTAVKAPPTASVLGARPAIRRATAMTTTIVTSRIRNPTDAGGARLHAAKQRRRERRARAPGRAPTPRITSAATVATRTSCRGRGTASPLLVNSDQDAGDQRSEHHDAAAGPLGVAAVHLGSQAHLAPLLGPGLEGVRARRNRSNDARRAGNVRKRTSAHRFPFRRPLHAPGLPLRHNGHLVRPNLYSLD